MKRFFTNLCVVISLTIFVVLPVQGKFRDALNFRDFNFVKMKNIELLHRYQQYTDCESEAYDRSQLTYQLSYGVFTNFELGLSFPVKFYESGENGLGDVQVYQKFKFTEQHGALPTSSGGFELILPTGDESSSPPLGSDKLDARFFFTAGQDFWGNYRWLVNGAVLFAGESEFDDKYEYNAALNYRPGSRVKTVLELNGHSGGPRDLSETYLAPGLILQPKDSFSFHVSVPVGLGNDAADYKTAFQFAVNF